MIARKKRLRSYKARKEKKKNLLPFFLIILLLGSLLFYILATSPFWDGKSKLSLVINTKDEEVIVSTYDPTTSEIINIYIPGDTEVELSRNLGKIRIKNAWAVGLNQGEEGVILLETVRRNFKFPVFAWADGKASGFSQTNLPALISAAFTPYRTNLKLGDRVALAVFAIGIKNAKREDIDLRDTSFLQEATLVDGRSGYTLTGKFPQSLLVVLGDELISSEEVTVSIVDATGDFEVSSYLTSIIEVMGAKVVSIEKNPVQAYDCEIEGTNKEIVEKIAKVFECSASNSEVKGNFDIVIKVGEDFASRF